MRFGMAQTWIYPKSGPGYFHLGYLLLLDALDAPDKRRGTKAAALLAAAQEAGLKTAWTS